jgi:hypothetical protein
MSRRLLAGCGGLVAAIAAIIAALWLANPWRRWQPPTVALPVPNAFDDYARAAELASEKFDNKNPADDPWLNAAPRRRILAENAEALRVLRAGFAHEYAEPRTPDSFGNTPFFAKYRKLARVLSWEAMEYAANGRYAVAIDSQLDTERFGLDMARRAGEIGQLVGDAVRGIGRWEREVQPRIDHLSAAEARAAATRLAGMLAGEESLAQTFADERDIKLAEYARLSRSLDGWRLAFSLADDNGPRAARPLAVLGLAPWMSEYRRYMDAAAAWAPQPWNAAPPRPARLFSEYSGQYADFLAKARFKYVHADAADQMFVAALALQAWRAEHGGYPDTLEALVPDILKDVPADPFAGSPLRYRRDGETYVLYSVGPDGRDDGGEPAVMRDEKTGQWEYQVVLGSSGDMVWVTSARLAGTRKP